jgi:hypothetical protein
VSAVRGVDDSLSSARWRSPRPAMGSSILEYRLASKFYFLERAQDYYKKTASSHW